MNSYTKDTSQNLQTYCLAIITVAIVTYMVYWLRPVLVPFVVALFVVSGITPILESVEKVLHVNRLIASVIAFVSGILILGLLSFCLWGSVQQLTREGNAYRARVGELLVSVQNWLPKGFLASNASGDAQAGLDEDAEEDSQEPLEESGESAATPGPARQADSLPPSLSSETTSEGMNPELQADLSSFREAIDRSIRQGLGQISSALFEFFSTSVVVLIYVFFLILGSEDSARLNHSMKAVDEQVRAYLFLKTVISVLTGVAFGLALWIFGVPMALTFGLLAFLLNYIPNVGPVVASLLPVPFILLSPDGSAIWMLAAISVTMAIQVVSGSVIEPKVMGDSSDLHPVVILLALMFWGMMWGVTGMFLATPITAGIKIVMEGYASTKPVANLLAGRFDSLAPEETSVA